MQVATRYCTGLSWRGSPEAAQVGFGSVIPGMYRSGIVAHVLLHTCCGSSALFRIWSPQNLLPFLHLHGWAPAILS